MVPLRAGEKALDRKALDWLRDEYDVFAGRFSPDMRYLAYASDEADVDINDVYVRPFDATKPEAPGPGPVVRVSQSGELGGIFWRQDGKEMYYFNRNLELVAVDVSTEPAFRVGASKVLFKAPRPMPGDITRDGQRIVFAVPVQ